MTTVAEVLRGRSTYDGDALYFEEHTWTYRQLVDEASRRAALFENLRDGARPPHIGVLLDNVPDYLFWLAAAAVSGSVVVGINSTYRGDQLAQLIRHTDCQLLVTTAALHSLLDGADTRVPPDRVLLVDSAEYAAALADCGRPPDRAGPGGRPLPPHLHVRVDGAAQGGAVHSGPVSADRLTRCGDRRPRRP